IGVIWMVQILVFDSFFLSVTKSKVKRSLLDVVQTEDLTEMMQKGKRFAEEKRVCLTVFRRSENETETILDESFDWECHLHKMTREETEAYFSLTVENGGYLAEQCGTADDTEAKNRLLTVASDLKKDGTLVFAFSDCPIKPLDLTGDALRGQLLLLSVFLLVFAAGLSFFLAGKISKPIENINKEAKNLSDTRLSPSFRERGYLEVSELTDTLNRTADELSRVERTQKELIANISHDLRTPLTMIIGYSEAMRDIEGENKPENAQVIIDEANRLSSLVNDLLEISNIQSGLTELSYEEFDWGEVASETVRRYAALKSYEGFDFRFSSAGCTCTLADKKKILQAFCNLLNNAVNYSSERKQVSVTVKETENGVYTEIKDCGEGIPQDKLKNIWQRYYKVDKVHHRSIAGSGLGLSIVREIMEMHGARYGVQSELGVGSVFWFEIMKKMVFHS
ncbi:MAG: HAMP domain-containing histidine kinase, partial [Clostridia bacterium]|nr:HAMP domain-containing histidine kinase [Clostridia bacterium]